MCVANTVTCKQGQNLIDNVYIMFNLQEITAINAVFKKKNQDSVNPHLSFYLNLSSEVSSAVHL